MSQSHEHGSLRQGVEEQPQHDQLPPALRAQGPDGVAMLWSNHTNGASTRKASVYRSPAKVRAGISSNPNLIRIQEVDQRKVTNRA